MRQVKISSMIQQSVNQVKETLFKSFCLRKWLALLFIAGMAGVLGSGTGFNLPDTNRFQDQQQAGQQAQAGNQATAQTPSQAQEDESKPGAEKIAFGTILIVSFLFSLWILFAWLGSRFQFIWYESIIKNKSAILEPFGRYQNLGQSLFLFNIVFGISGMLFFLGPIALSLFNAYQSGMFDQNYDWTLKQIGDTFGFAFFLALVGFLIISLVGTLLTDFVVPVMVLTGSRVQEGWRKLAALAKANLKDIFLYVLVKLGMNIVTSIGAALAMFAIVIAALFVGLALFGIPYFILVTLFKAVFVYQLYAVLLGIPSMLVLILLTASVNLPVATFYRSFSLFYLASLDAGYTALPLRKE